MPSPDDKMTDVPRIVPERDEVASYRRGRGETPDSRKAAKPAKPRDTEAVAGVSGGWRLLAVCGFLIAATAAAGAALLYRQAGELQAALEQSNLRIADLEGRLSSTDDSVNQSSASMQVKIKELSGEVDKLWASAWRKNNTRLDELDAELKKVGGTVDSDRRQLASLAAGQDSLKQQLGASQDLAGTVQALKDQQASHQSAIGRLSSTVNSLASTQSAQEARLKESEQWLQSNIEFRKQVTQRLTRLENPVSALPPQ